MLTRPRETNAGAGRTGGPKKGRETVEQCMARLRRTAMKTSRVLLKKAILNMSARVMAVYKAQGGNIDMD